MKFQYIKQKDKLDYFLMKKKHLKHKLIYQKKLLKKLRSGKKFAYEEASIYTVLFDLLEGNGLEETFMMLHNVASDLGARDLLESKFDEAKKWTWD